MDRIISININGKPKNAIIIPEHWNNNQTGFENADVYLIVDGEDESRLAAIAFSEDKSAWEINSELDGEAQNDLIDYIKSQSPLTAL
jgi:hypothetical protein